MPKKRPVKQPEENKLFPGRPKYVGPTEGYFAMLHHTELWEYSHDVMKRVRYVRRKKPLRERPTRLHNMLYLGSNWDNDLLALLRDRNVYKKVLAIVKKHIPDHAWDSKRKELKFPD